MHQFFSLLPKLHRPRLVQMAVRCNFGIALDNILSGIGRLSYITSSIPRRTKDGLSDMANIVDMDECCESQDWSILRPHDS